MSHYLTLRGVGQPIAYFPALAKYLNSINAAIFLGQIIYWHDKTDNPNGVYKTSLEFQNETGLSYREQATARKILREVGLITERNKRFEHRIYFKFNRNAFDSWLDEKISNNQCIIPSNENAVRKQQNSNSPNAKNAVREMPNKQFVIQENTTENTTDINLGADAPKAHKFSPKKFLIENDVSEQTAQEFIDLKNKKRKTITERSLKIIFNQAAEAKLTNERVFQIIVFKGWESFNATWNWSEANNQIEQLENPQANQPTIPQNFTADMGDW